MRNIHKNLYCGNDNDCLGMAWTRVPGMEVYQPVGEWAILHAAKEPYHRQFVKYIGRGAPKNHPEYLWAERGNRLALNLVDAPSPEFFDKRIINKALEFIGRKLGEGCKVLVHCNKGESRSPSLCLLYLIKVGLLKGPSLQDYMAEFYGIYPEYMPGDGIWLFIRDNWADYVGGKES